MPAEVLTLDSTTPRRYLGGAAALRTKGAPTAYIVEVLSLSGTSPAVQFRKTTIGSGVAAASAPLCAYENEQTGEVVAGETTATAVGRYRVPSDNADVIIELAAGDEATYLVTNVDEA